MKYILIGGFLIIIGAFLISYPFFFFDSSEYNPSNKNLVSLKSYLVTDPIYVREPGGTKSSGTYAIRIRLEGYPAILFDNDGMFLEATDYKAILKHVKSGDTVTVKVLKDELSKYGQPTIPQSISEKFSIPPHLNFYSLNFKGREYVIDLEDKAKDQNRRFKFPCLFFGFLFCAFGIRYIIFKR
jgi:hypothetical protein